MKRSGISTILFAVTGKSPAVLTETVWQLVHSSPAVIPDQIVVLTTIDGKAEIESQLFKNNIWDALIDAITKRGFNTTGKLEFGMSNKHIRIFPSADGRSDINDIITTEDASAAGDFILNSLRAYTEIPTTQIIASVAGGRKTMGVLLANCMVLVGRKQDRLCHILVNPPYDSALLEPRFYYSGQENTHTNSVTGEKFKSEDADIQLADIPFVRVRDIDWSPATIPASYSHMVARTQERLEKVILPIITIKFLDGTISVNGSTIELSSVEFAVIYSLALSFKEKSSIHYWGELETCLQELHNRVDVPDNIFWLHNFQGKDFPDMKEDIRKIVSRIRRKLIDKDIDKIVVGRLLPNLRKKVEPYPANKIKII